MEEKVHRIAGSTRRDVPQAPVARHHVGGDRLRARDAEPPVPERLEARLARGIERALLVGRLGLASAALRRALATCRSRHGLGGQDHPRRELPLHDGAAGPGEDQHRPVAPGEADPARGDEAAADRLLPLVYDELRAIAGSYFRGQPARQTLQPTALVHEAYLRLIDQTSASFNDRTHFLAVAATAMRQILANHARARGAAKRGGGWERVTLDQAVDGRGGPDIDLIDFEQTLTRLEELNERHARIVQLRFFGGLSQTETARVLGVHLRTVERRQQDAERWYMSQFGDD